MFDGTEVGSCLKTPPDSRMQEEMENEEISLINALNPGDAGLVAGRPPLSPLPLLHTPEIRSTEPMAPPLCDEGRISPSKTHQGARFGQAASLSGADSSLRGSTLWTG